MQQVDPAYLFETGDASRLIKRVKSSQDRVETYLALTRASDSIRQIIYASIYKDYFHYPLINSAQNVIDRIQNLMTKLFPDDGEGEDINEWEVQSLHTLYNKYETILISELQSITMYIVTRKSGFEVSSMVTDGKVFFAPDLETKVPDAIYDLQQAMRCIAFELPTAAGFHLHRANESVLRIYWDNVTDGLKRPSRSNMGVYLSELKRLDLGKQSVIAHLQSIKDFHRNPLMHPEQSLDSIEQAIDLMSAIRCAIGYMLEEIPVRSSAAQIAK